MLLERCIFRISEIGVSKTDQLESSAAPPPHRESACRLMSNPAPADHGRSILCVNEAGAIEAREDAATSTAVDIGELYLLASQVGVRVIHAA